MRIEVDEPISLQSLQAMGDLKERTKEMRRRYKEWYEAMANKIEQTV